MYSSAASNLGSPCLQRPVCLNTEDKCSKVNILNQTEKSPVSHPGRRFILFIYLFIFIFFLLIQEGQLSVSGKRMCTNTG